MLRKLKQGQPFFCGLMVFMIGLALLSRLYRFAGLARDAALYVALLTLVSLGAWLFRRRG